MIGEIYSESNPVITTQLHLATFSVIQTVFDNFWPRLEHDHVRGSIKFKYMNILSFLSGSWSQLGVPYYDVGSSHWSGR